MTDTLDKMQCDCEISHHSHSVGAEEIQPSAGVI